MIVRLVLQVCALPPKNVCLLWSSSHLFDCMREHDHVFDFLRAFQTLFPCDDVPDFNLLLASCGVVLQVQL